jgi:CRP/FNR family transcriptional regulator, cyclic AMP receptor protein
MSAKGIPTRNQRHPAKWEPSVDSMRSASLAINEIANPPRLQIRKLQPRNSRAVFDPGTFLARAGSGRKSLILKKKEVAYAQGDPADAMFYVQKGQLRVTVTSASGKEATIALVGAGEFVGEDCMVLAHPLRLATATAITECVLLRISKAEMIRVLHQEQAMSDVFVSFLLARNARIQADLVDQLFNSSEKRLARILLLLAQFGKESKPETVVPKLSQNVLAEMIGTTRSRVSFFMNRFRKLGFIEYDGEIRVHNSLLNIFLHE